MFSQTLYDNAKAVWNKSKTHPFIQELILGNLEQNIFRFYLLQDCYYLKHFSEAHQCLAAKTKNPLVREIQLICKNGLEIAEIEVRKAFFKELKITDKEYQNMLVAPTAYHYTSHIYREIFLGTDATALAALLPCYWLYNEIGKSFANQGSPVDIYDRWLKTYESDEFSNITQNQIDLLDELATEATASEKDKILSAFMISSIEELNFWEMAYKKESWL